MDTKRNSYDDTPAVPAKKVKTEWSKTYSYKAMEMMKKMGYENDKGLGKESQGILEPLTPFQHDGRRGLGLKSSENSILVQWNEDEEEVNIPEKIKWVGDNNFVWTFSLEEMIRWIRFKENKYFMHAEVTFCKANVLDQILKGKSFFDGLNDHELRKARSRSNPFETIRNSIFLNRAAVKMANIDSLCDFMFTHPATLSSGKSNFDDNDLLYFADLCAGPGGFSEYVLYRKSWSAKGFGFTLRGSNDFTLEKFFAGSPESFDPFYGVRADGNIYHEENQNSLSNYIRKHCPNGVHFVMADGGFSVDGQENFQEILSKQLYLCQCLTAIKILRPRGHFVCKFFDLYTPFSVALVFLMYKSFEQIAIIKPNSSRPANSERYLVCKNKRDDTSAICSYLNHINKLLNENNDHHISEIIDIELIKSDEVFYNYIVDSNNSIGKNQILSLRKVAAFYHNPHLKESRQSECRRLCLRLWKLPDKLRQPLEIRSVESLLEQILGNWYTDRLLLNSKPVELQSKLSLSDKIESIYDWKLVPVGREETLTNSCSIFLSKSRGNLLRYTENKKWDALEYFFEIPFPSLFFGEIVNEYNGEGKTQTRACSLHIIDAVMLGGIDVRRLRLKDRMKMCAKFACSINKPFNERKKNIVRGKPFYKLIEIDSFFQDMQYYTLKDNSTRLGLSLNSEGTFFVPGGVLILCEICHNFFSMKSKTRNMLYYVDKLRKKSYYFECMPTDVQNILYASFRNSFLRRLLWKWTSTMQVTEKCDDLKGKLLYRNDVLHFIKEKS